MALDQPFGVAVRTRGEERTHLGLPPGQVFQTRNQNFCVNGYGKVVVYSQIPVIENVFALIKCGE